MGDPERAHYSKIKNHHHHPQKDRVSDKQKPPFLRHAYGRGGPPVGIQLNDSVSYKHNASLLRHCYGRGVSPVDVQLQKGVAKKAMIPASPSQASSSSEASDSPCTSKTKVVVRSLPPLLSEKSFTESILPRFDGLFNWISFCPGKASKNISNSRVYIDFKSPEDVFKFHEEFNGHLFVNEKGTRYKALVEYAPNQCVPKPSPEKDKQEGSIAEDSEYLEFQNVLSIPIQLLPSAEVQLEKKEAEKRSSLAGAKKTVVVTPLMEYVRHNRSLRAQSVVVAPGKQIACRGRLSSANSTVLPPQASDISRTSFKNASPSGKPTEKLTYVPRPHRETNQRKEFSLDTKRKTFFEVQGKVVRKEKGLDKFIQNDQNFGASRHSVTCRQTRKDVDTSKKSKQMGGFRSHEKQVWVAKSASGS